MFAQCCKTTPDASTPSTGTAPENVFSLLETTSKSTSGKVFFFFCFYSLFSLFCFDTFLFGQTALTSGN